MADSISRLRRLPLLGARLAAVPGGGRESEAPSMGASVHAGEWLASQGEAKPQRISKEAAALLLIADTALGELSVEDAVRIVSYMKPKRLRPGTALIRQGERDTTHFMALVLDGSMEVVVKEGESRQVLGVMGPGAVIGEMSLVDGDARSASCVAMGHVGVGLLTREALARMMDTEPELAARLVLILMHHVTKRLRETTRKLKFTAQLNDALRAELRAHGFSQEEPEFAAEADSLFEAPFNPGDTVKLYPSGGPD